MRIAIEATASPAVGQTTTIDVTTLVRIRTEDRVRNLAVLMIDDVIPNRHKADAETLVRLKVDQIVGQTAPVLNLVARMIDVVTPNHRKADAETSVHHREEQIVALADLVLHLVDRMIDDANFNRRIVNVMASAHLPVDRVVTLARRSAAPAMIVVASSRLTAAIAVASLRSMAAVMIVDAATSVRRSVDQIMIAATWDLRRAIGAAISTVVPVTLARHKDVPIANVATSIRRCGAQATSVATSDRLRAIEATKVVATAVVRNGRCGTSSRSSALV